MGQAMELPSKTKDTPGALAVDPHVLIRSCLRQRRAGDAVEPGALGDGAIDWLATIKRANDGLVGPALWTAFSELGLLGELPADVRDYLQLLHEHNHRCNLQIREQCVALGNALAGAGVEAVLLKGATWLFEAGPAHDDRMLRDIDLLIDPLRNDSIRIAMRAIGYRAAPHIAAEPGHIHGAPLIQPGSLVSVEAHREITTRVKLLPGKEVLAASTPIAAGLRLPSPTHRILHNVLHAEIVNGDHLGGAVSLRDSLDLARLVAAHHSVVDWMAMAETARQRGYFRQLSGALHKAARFAGGPLPSPFSEDRGGHRHALRCALQRRLPPLDAGLRSLGVLARALAWERDAYTLGLGDDRSLLAHLEVNQRRLQRIGEAIRRGR